MNDVTTVVEGSIHINATPSTVFSYCLDPQRLFAGDPKHVVDADVVPGGVGTTAHLSMHMGVLEEADRIGYVDVVGDQRIVIAMHPTMSLGGSKGVHRETALYTLTHEFESEDEGTRMTLRVQVHDPPLVERVIQRFEGRGAERMVRNRLERVAHAVEVPATPE